MINRLKNKFKNNTVFLFGLFIVFVGLTFVYRGVFLEKQVLFPSNLLVSLYPPWSTAKFAGWEQGIPYKPIGGNDQARLFYPLRTLTNEAFSKGRIPLWNPYIFSGNPLMADFQSAVFYPLNIIYFFLPQITAWSILVVIPLILSFIFMYIFLREVGCAKEAAVMGGLAFGFCGFLLTWTQENAAVGQAGLWLPLMLFGLEKTMNTRKYRFVLLTVFAFVCSFLGGFYQITFYAWITAIVYGLFLIISTHQNRKYNLFLLILIIILSLCLSAVQLIPSSEAFFNSPRGSATIWYLFERYLVPAGHLINAFFPDIQGNPGTYTFFGEGFYHETILYIGLIPLMFAIFSMFTVFKQSKVRFFIALALVSAILTIRSPFTYWFFKLPIPLVATFVPSRIFYITSFALATLSAFGVNRYLIMDKKKSAVLIKRTIFIFALVMFLPVLYIAMIYFLDRKILLTTIDMFFAVTGLEVVRGTALAVMTRAVAIQWGFLIAAGLIMVLPIERKRAIYMLIVLAAIGQFFFLNKYAVLGYRQFLYPQHFIFSFLSDNSKNAERFIAFGRPISGNLSVDKHVFTPEGLDAVFSPRYGEFALETKISDRLETDVSRIEVTLSELGTDESLTDNPKRLKLLSLLGVKYIFYYSQDDTAKETIDRKFPGELFLPLWEKDKWYAFENKHVLPRIFLATDYVIRSNNQDILDTFFSDGFNPAQTVILEEEPGGDFEMGSDDKDSFSEIIAYEPEKVVVKTDSSKNSLLFLSDNYYPGWEAFVDGRPSKIYRADYSFRAVSVPAGAHIITYIYNPSSFKTGVIITGLTLLMISLSVIFFHLKKNTPT